MIRMTKLCVLLLIVSLSTCVYAENATKTEYQILKQISLPDNGGWDYLLVDSDARRIYITHETEVLVLDADTYKILGTIDGIQGAHGVALVPEINRGFISSGKSGTVVVFDLKTLKKISEITAQKGSDAIVYDSASGNVFSFNGESQTATVIAAATGKVIKTISLGGKPEYAAVDGRGHIFDNLEDKNLVLEIDTKTLEVTHRWPLAPGDSPSGLAADGANNRLFAGCHNKMVVVMNATNGKVVQTLPIGDHIDATFYDAGSGTVFNSCGDGTLSVIHQSSPDQYEVVENAKTELGARTMAFDAKTGHVFLVTAKMEPPATPTKESPKPRRKIIPGTLKLLVLGQ